MCGIAGFLGAPPGCSADERIGLLRRMGDRIAHRGPDHGGVWSDPEADAGIVHRRLAIVDLSPAGHQPMASASGRWVLAFNGEIYNHRELRDRLAAAGEAPAWRGRSDTETLLAAIEAWGITTTLRRCVGMFAIAAWDRATRRLVLARDRLGEKPLYVGWAGGSLLFASELKAMRAHPQWRGDVDRDALAAYFRWGYVPAPASIHVGVSKLPAGCTVELTLDDVRRRALPAPRAYWSLADVAERGTREPFAGSEAAALDELERLLQRAVDLQRVADVPLGAFLSGGVDSSTVVALMQRHASTPVRTFTIGFTDDAFDESGHAEAVARHLGTRHERLVVGHEEVLATVPRLPDLYDEPFADPSQLPTACLSALARRHVTVSLSGDGADELFGGYERYHRTRRLADTLLRLPPALRRAAAEAILACPPRAIDLAAAPLRPLAPSLRAGRPSRKAVRFARLLASADPGAAFLHQTTHWPATDSPVLGGTDDSDLRWGTPDPAGGPDALERWMSTVDGLVYLPDDVLAKVDRAAMAVGLETRVPFLDHRVVEFAYSLPTSLRTGSGEGKVLLKRLLERYVPRTLTERPKMGFGVPIDRWLRGPLRDWAEALLDPARLAREGYLDVERVRRTWDEHLHEGARNGHYLWDALMFQAWLERQGPA